jgi:hypothetical protein
MRLRSSSGIDITLSKRARLAASVFTFLRSRSLGRSPSLGRVVVAAKCITLLSLDFGRQARRLPSHFPVAASFQNEFDVRHHLVELERIVN